MQGYFLPLKYPALCIRLLRGCNLHHCDHVLQKDAIQLHLPELYSKQIGLLSSPFTIEDAASLDGVVSVSASRNRA
jgi:hypothetical protein